ncbi:MAG: hypothetical protein MZV70_64415 [Desulfobacterales bacterium]|nr:hypothetical protein [Desulfobacterales bacterium]
MIVVPCHSCHGQLEQHQGALRHGGAGGEIPLGARGGRPRGRLTSGR